MQPPLRGISAIAIRLFPFIHSKKNGPTLEMQVTAMLTATTTPVRMMNCGGELDTIAGSDADVGGADVGKADVGEADAADLLNVSRKSGQSTLLP